MSPTSYQTAPPREVMLWGYCEPVKLGFVKDWRSVGGPPGLFLLFRLRAFLLHLLRTAEAQTVLGVG